MINIIKLAVCFLLSTQDYNISNQLLSNLPKSFYAIFRGRYSFWEVFVNTFLTSWTLNPKWIMSKFSYTLFLKRALLNSWKFVYLPLSTASNLLLCGGFYPIINYEQSIYSALIFKNYSLTSTPIFLNVFHPKSSYFVEDRALFKSMILFIL